MKIKIEVNIVKHKDDTYSARFKENYKVEQKNLKHVSVDEIADYIVDSIEEADEKGMISTV